jgi:hypothetical protein
MQHIVFNHLRGMINDNGWQWSISWLIGHAPFDLVPERLGQYCETGDTDSL